MAHYWTRLELQPRKPRIVRAAILDDEPAPGDVVATNTGKIKRIGRGDLAAFLVWEAREGTYSRQAISVTKSGCLLTSSPVAGSAGSSTKRSAPAAGGSSGSGAPRPKFVDGWPRVRSAAGRRAARSSTARPGQAGRAVQASTLPNPGSERRRRPVPPTPTALDQVLVGRWPEVRWRCSSPRHPGTLLVRSPEATPARPPTSDQGPRVRPAGGRRAVRPQAFVVRLDAGCRCRRVRISDCQGRRSGRPRSRDRPRRRPAVRRERHDAVHRRRGSPRPPMAAARAQGPFQPRRVLRAHRAVWRRRERVRAGDSRPGRRPAA